MRAAASTFSRVASVTLSSPFMARDAEATETSASRATSLMVARLGVLMAASRLPPRRPGSRQARHLDYEHIDVTGFICKGSEPRAQFPSHQPRPVPEWLP